MNLESRALQNIPSERPPDDDLEIPAANSLAMLTFDRDVFCTARFVALTNHDLVQAVADIGSRITVQGPQEIGTANGVSPLRVRTGIAVFIAHAAQIERRSHAPEVSDVGSFATTGGAEVCVDR